MSAAESEVIKQSESNPATILCVDDEPQILSSLKRFFRRARYNVLTANSGAEALQVLEKEKVDLVISDMRMPEMTGAELLAESAKRWPDTFRILLTGYADLESSVAAINEGKIYRYLSKPWDEEALSFAVESALEQKMLKDEKIRLEALTKQQNEKLKDLNNNLEEKVKARTADLQKAAVMLKKSIAQLKASYKDSMLVFNNLIDIRTNISSANNHEVAGFCTKMAEEMNLDENLKDDIYLAALLSNIGKIGLSDELLNVSYPELSDEQKIIYNEYPQIGQAILLAIPRLYSVGSIICSHKERHDGKGFPYGLKGDDIPIGAKILAVVYDFYATQSGELTGKMSSRDEALSFILVNSDTHYDPEIVKVFRTVLKHHHGSVQMAKELGLLIEDLHPDMVLTRNVTFRGGMLLLKNGQKLTTELISKINNIQKEIDDKTIYVSIKNG